MDRNISDLVVKVVEKKPKRVLLQLPEGLKSKAMEIVSALQDRNIEVVISGDPCYGACDLQEEQASKMNCDLLVHVGHSRFFKSGGKDADVSVLYYSWEVGVKLNDKELEKVKETKVAIATTVQHLSVLESTKAKLEGLGKKVEVLGQVLGCSKTDYKSDAVLFIGSGLFHPTNLRGKVYRYDIERASIEDITDICMKEEKKKQARLALLKDAETVCIIVSTKPGQFLSNYQEIVRKLKERHKKVFTLIMNEIKDPEHTVKADIFINTACPRLVEDYNKMINASDIDL